MNISKQTFAATLNPKHRIEKEINVPLKCETIHSKSWFHLLLQATSQTTVSDITINEFLIRIFILTIIIVIIIIIIITTTIIIIITMMIIIIIIIIITTTIINDRKLLRFNIKTLSEKYLAFYVIQQSLY